MCDYLLLDPSYTWPDVPPDRGRIPYLENVERLMDIHNVRNVLVASAMDAMCQTA